MAVAPAAKVVGTVNPETETPEPEKVIPEILTLAVPVLANCTVFVTSLPTETVPKAMDEGVAVSADVGAVVAVPLRPITTEGSEPALLIETDPDSVPAEPGL